MSGQIGFKAVAMAVFATVALGYSPASAQTPSGNLSRYPMILTFKFGGLLGRSEEQALDSYARDAGDACPATVRAVLKNAGARVFLNDTILGGGSVFDLNGIPRNDSEVSGKVADLNSVSEIEFRIQPWWPALSIRNASHFANVMFSEPWKELRKKEIGGGGLSALSWGYLRAALVTANLKPLVRPEELKEDGIENDWMKSDRSWLGIPRQPPSDEMTNMLGQMCEIFAEDANGRIPSGACLPKRTPTSLRDFATSHQLDTSGGEAMKFVSLTTANILVDEMRFENGKSVPAGVIAAMQNLLDQAAAQCSKINAGEELNELRRIQSSMTLNPVDLDAFQSRRRSVLERYPSKFGLNVFDEIQALK